MAVGGVNHAGATAAVLVMGFGMHLHLWEGAVKFQGSVS